MKSVWKDRRFRVCALLFAGLLGPALYWEHIDKYHPFPFIWILHSVTISSWLLGLYCRWSGRWRPGDGRVWGGWVLLCGLFFQFPVCGVSGVSRVLLGISLVLGIGGILSAKQ